MVKRKRLKAAVTDLDKLTGMGLIFPETIIEVNRVAVHVERKGGRQIVVVIYTEEVELEDGISKGLIE
jgi:hypothetical protein